ncbi:MAG: hypothetical protein E7218_03295 [Anaerofustis stercorihominis]|nr:hypothetical protein [Anaerofustis stercorihominis]
MDYYKDEYKKDECDFVCEAAKAGLAVLAFAAASALVYTGMHLIKDKKEESDLGGKLLKVNYKFSKEF